MGATKSTGKNTSEKRKESTKKFKEEKLAAKKSNYKIDKFGYKIKKNIVEQYKDKSLISSLGSIKDDNNLYRRMRFSDQKGIDISNMSTKEIMSKSFKSTLTSKGYLDPTKSGDMGKGGKGGEKGQVKLPRKQGLKNANNEFSNEQLYTTTAPTTAEVSQSEAANADDVYTRRRKSKAKGRSIMTLTSAQGVKDNKLTLGKKSLLGT